MIVSQIDAKTLSENDRFWIGNIASVQKSANDIFDRFLSPDTLFGRN